MVSGVVPLKQAYQDYWLTLVTTERPELSFAAAPRPCTLSPKSTSNLPKLLCAHSLLAASGSVRTHRFRICPISPIGVCWTVLSPFVLLILP